MRSSSGLSATSKASEIRQSSSIIILLSFLFLSLDYSESFATSSCHRCRCTFSSPLSSGWQNPTIQQYPVTQNSIFKYDCGSLASERKSTLRSPARISNKSHRLFVRTSNSGGDESNQQQHMESSSSSSLSRKFERKQYPLFSTAIKSLRIRAKSLMTSLRFLLGKGQMMMKRLKKPLVVISAVIMIFTARTPPAQAKFGHEINDGDKVYSIRPGATQAQASQLLEGEVPEEMEDSTGIPSSTTTTGATSKKQESDSSKKKASAFDYGDEDDDEDDFLFLEENEPRKDLRKAPLSRMGTASSAISSSSEGVGSTKAQFTGMSGGKSKSLYAKVSIGLFIPTWGAMGVREFVRRRKEETYVQKGLEILEQQKKEYFGDDSNSTSTDEEDDDEDEDEDEDDDEDEGDEDSSSDDDDEGDDDDDDETPPPSSRKGGPKKPPSSGGSGGNDPGYGRASDDDIKKLGNLFDKS